MTFVVEDGRHSGGDGGVRNCWVLVMVEEEAGLEEACMVAVEGEAGPWNAMLVEETEWGEGRTDRRAGRSGVDAFSTWSSRT